MFDETRCDNLAVVLSDLNLPEDQKRQIGDAVVGVAAAFDQRDIGPIPSLIALSYASGVYLTLLQSDRREAVAAALNRVRSHATKHAEQLDATLTAAEARALTDDIDGDDVSSDVIASRLSDWFGAVGISEAVALSAMMKLIAYVVKDLPFEQRAGQVADFFQWLQKNCDIAPNQLN